MLRRVGLLVLCVGPLSAGLLRLEVAERSDVLQGRAFGNAGPYERIVGKAYFAVDPKLPANQIIADIDKAPRNDEGKVEFSSDVYVLKPRDSHNSNGTVLFQGQLPYVQGNHTWEISSCCERNPQVRWE